MHEYHSHNFSYLCASSVCIQHSDDFLDRKWRKTFFIVRGHMIEGLTRGVIQLGRGQRLIHSTVAILSDKKQGWHGLFVFHNTF